MEMNRNNVIMIAVVVLAIAAGVYWYMSRGTQEPIQIQQKGSDTLLILAQRWAESYIEDNSNVDIVVSGGGSGTGISALINKQIDIADASRQIKQQELDAAEEAGVDPVEWKVAVDGISIIVNLDNPLTEMSYSQLKGIYVGTVKNWNEIGGTDGTVVAYGRQSTSGTYGYFQEEVLDDEDYRSDKNQMSGNADIVEAVINDPNGIGYVGVAYAEARSDDLKILNIKREDTGTAYQPTSSNIASGDYPISRYLYVYTDGVPEGAISDYLRFILSPEGKGITEEVGYIPLPESLMSSQLSELS